MKTDDIGHTTLSTETQRLFTFYEIHGSKHDKSILAVKDAMDIAADTSKFTTSLKTVSKFFYQDTVPFATHYTSDIRNGRQKETIKDAQ